MKVEHARRLDEADHRSLALWAADCAEHVLPYFEGNYLEDDRPRQALETWRAWARGEIACGKARAAGRMLCLHIEHHRPGVTALIVGRLRTPKGFEPPAQPSEQRATLGIQSATPSLLKGLHSPGRRILAQGSDTTLSGLTVFWHRRPRVARSSLG